MRSRGVDYTHTSTDQITVSHSKMRARLSCWLLCALVGHSYACCGGWLQPSCALLVLLLCATPQLVTRHTTPTPSRRHCWRRAMQQHQQSSSSACLRAVGTKRISTLSLASGMASSSPPYPPSSEFGGAPAAACAITAAQERTRGAGREVQLATATMRYRVGWCMCSPPQLDYSLARHTFLCSCVCACPVTDPQCNASALTLIVCVYLRRYEGPNSTNPLSFRYYNADEVVLGKPMKEW